MVIDFLMFYAVFCVSFTWPAVMLGTVLPTGVRSEPGTDHDTVGRTNAHFIAKNHCIYQYKT